MPAVAEGRVQGQSGLQRGSVAQNRTGMGMY